MPSDWLEQLKAHYPTRSGGYGFLDMRLVLSIRRALQTHTWEQIIDAIKAYKAYCQQSGKEGSEFVQKPKAWFDQGGYAEEWAYAAPIDPRDAERARQADAADRRAAEAGARVGLTRHPLESRAAFETRVQMALVHFAVERDPRNSPALGQSIQLQSRVTRLAAKLRA